MLSPLYTKGGFLFCFFFCVEGAGHEAKLYFCPPPTWFGKFPDFQHPQSFVYRMHKITHKSFKKLRAAIYNKGHYLNMHNTEVVQPGWHRLWICEGGVPIPCTSVPHPVERECHICVPCTRSLAKLHPCGWRLCRWILTHDEVLACIRIHSIPALRPTCAKFVHTLVVCLFITSVWVKLWPI